MLNKNLFMKGVICLNFVESDFVNYIFESFKSIINNALIDDPISFKYSLYIFNMINSLNLSIDNLSDSSYNKIFYEFSRFLHNSF